MAVGRRNLIVFNFQYSTTLANSHVEGRGTLDSIGDMVFKRASKTTIFFAFALLMITAVRPYEHGA